MPKSKNLFVTLCQQVSAVAVVGVVAVSAAGVVVLDIQPPVGVRTQPSTQPVTQHSTGSQAAPEDRSVVPTRPVEPTVREVALTHERSAEPTRQSRVQEKSPTQDDSPQEIVVFSKAEKVTGYATVGVTWDGRQKLSEEDVAFSIRTQTDGGWSAWQEMHYDAEHGADADEVEDGREVRSGTEPVVVGDVDRVQVRATSRGGVTPRGMSVDLVDPGEDTQSAEEPPEIDATATTAGHESSGEGDIELSAKKLSAPRPKIFSRSQWGADERLRDKGSLRYGEIHAGFVHHTVNANDYSRDDVPAILRGIYAYHTKSRGWSDVGYNFLVDRFGRIWEGRAGGVGKPVVGAHTLGYNDDSFAMSAIGNFETARPTKAMIEAYAALMAWKLGKHGVDASATRVFVTSRYFQAINGHRDAGSTACPGRYLYAELPQIRKLAAKIQKTGTPPKPAPEPEEPPKPTTGTPLSGDLAATGWPDLVVRDAATKNVVIVPTGGQLGFAGSGTVAVSDWNRTDLVAVPGDIDGDGAIEVIARSGATKKARDFRVTKGGALRPAGHVYTRFNKLDQLTGVGDMNGDGHVDLVGRRTANKRLVLIPGRGGGSFGAIKVLSTDWRRYDLTVGVGDLTGDGRPDLVARSGATLWLVPGTAKGIGKPVALPGSFSGYDLVAGRGDATGDGRPDLIVRAAGNGLVYVFPGDGAGGLKARLGGWNGFVSARWIGLAGQLTGSKHPDMVALAGGRLSVFAHNGRTNLRGVVDTGAALPGTDLVLNAGDWNGDGRGDVVTRDASSGELHLRAGQANGKLAAPVLIGGSAWKSVKHVTAVGDVTGDGKPDLAGKQAGTYRIFHGNGTGRFRTTTDLSVDFKPTGLVNLGLWDGDKFPDLGFRRKNGTLWFVPRDGGKAVQVAKNLKRYDWLRGLGDLDGDGRSDLVVRARSGGDLFLLRGQANGFGPRRIIGTGFDRYDLG